MMAQEFVLKQRTEILAAVCSSGSSEQLERLLDVLLAHGELSWEEYQSIQVQGRPLHANARHLLDIVYTKGLAICQLFVAALQQTIPEGPGARLCVSEGVSQVEKSREAHQTSGAALLSQRPSLVGKLQGCVDGALEVLHETGHFTSEDCNEVRLPIHTPSQQARRLLDLVSSKGELAANVVLQFIDQKQQSGRSSLTPPKEFFKYQKKLCSSVLAQSSFLSTYGGTSHMPLDDIYTEGQLELAADLEVQGNLGLGDIVSTAGIINEEADTVLVSGDAGSGKSTLLQRLHLLWARGTALSEFLLLFPFSCRKLNSELKELSVQDLLFRHCCWPDWEQEDIFRFILDHPHVVIFTFDGLDELKQSFSDEHRLCCPTQPAPVHVLLFNLLQGSLMKGVRKVVTSRSEAVGPILKKYLRKEVFLKGFSPNGIDCFVKKQHHDPAVAAKVLASIQANTFLLGLCHSPVLCWIVSQCHKELLGCGDGTPQTITDVYLMILQRFLQHQSSLKTSKGSDLDSCCVTEKDICTGFLIQSKDMSNDYSHQYEFLHLTVQCFFAALYIVLFNNADRSTITKLFALHDLRETGFSSTCFTSCLAADQRQTPGSADGQKSATLGEMSLQRHAEALQVHPTASGSKMAKEVLGKLDVDHLKLTYCNIGPVECTALAYVLQHLRNSVGIQLDNNSVGDVGVEQLLPCLHICNSLYLRNNNITDEGIRKLIAKGLQCDSFQKIALFNNKLTDACTEHFSHLLRTKQNFLSLRLGNNNITSEGAKQLAKGLEFNHSLRFLGLWGNKVGDAGAEAIAGALEGSKTLTWLSLVGNGVGSAGARALAKMIKSDTSLEELWLTENCITRHGVEFLLEALEHNTHVKSVWLRNNNLSVEEVEEMTQRESRLIF
ncbi:nucleotide-binding oligomerization domain-containing protein 2 isoform X3 [Entelurus aequoreus]|uniref:nucleotide-binding oligomerization domain-containing protein 2 isoform X3 n=1 Tax=Entelurus aequoreus TaxID=161455 RepID=UPI002B1CE3C7|nr:nucleotide-binding oligomerization domain-containing protein 2 isoform X3 [Entelurus aequoreus]